MIVHAGQAPVCPTCRAEVGMVWFWENGHNVGVPVTSITKLVSNQKWTDVYVRGQFVGMAKESIVSIMRRTTGWVALSRSVAVRAASIEAIDGHYVNHNWKGVAVVCGERIPISRRTWSALRRILR